MNLTDIIIFSAVSVVVRLFLVNRGRQRVLFVLSILGVYWLQPITPLRNFDFWFPTLTLTLVLIVWVITASKEDRKSSENLFSLGMLVGIILLISLSRSFFYEGLITRTRPPQIQQVIVFFLFFALFLGFIHYLDKAKKFLFTSAILFIVLIFICLKSPWMASSVSVGIRNIMNQSSALASAVDLRWLGFSYVSFRLIHVLRDCQNGRCRRVSLQEFVNYVIFFPAFVAGPIDRLERFIGDLDTTLDRSADDFVEGGKRIFIGLLKKFVVADTLALVALNANSAVELTSQGWGWVLLFSYSFQIFFDFSGYTDIAIGIARILGIKLPENFKQPYLQQNLTTFWNNWHMTLTNWFRAYFFNPVTRSLRRKRKFSQVSILLITQLGTMVLIGLWHGITWSFVIWGIWHGMGLFIQNRWSDWARPRIESLNPGKTTKTVIKIFNIFATFTYVSLGWVWFALPEVSLSWQFLSQLFFHS